MDGALIATAPRRQRCTSPTVLSGTGCSPVWHGACSHNMGIPFEEGLAQVMDCMTVARRSNSASLQGLFLRQVIVVLASVCHADVL